MPPTDPFQQQLQALNANVPNLQLALNALFALRKRNYAGERTNLGALYQGEAKRLQDLLGATRQRIGQGQAAGLRNVTANAYKLDPAQLRQVSGMVATGVRPSLTEATGFGRARVREARATRASAMAEPQALIGALPRERSAAQHEIEQGVIDLQTNLRLQSEEYRQQQAYNQSLQRFYDANVANYRAQLAPSQLGTAAAGGGIIAAARRYLGIPYKWGGESLSGFDCSGLVQQVFADNGIRVPRTAAQQQAASGYVGGLGSAKPGDLLFWGHPAHHVAIYIGNGMMIAAPHSGAVVRVQRVYGTPEVRRVGGGSQSIPGGGGKFI
jgi:cell wall-associated NlpC family hydrolase